MCTLLWHVLYLNAMIDTYFSLGFPEEEAKKIMMGGDVRPAWMRALQESTSNWLGALPEKLTPLRRTAENIKVSAVLGTQTNPPQCKNLTITH